MVRQFRLAAGRTLLEIPAGTLDRAADGSLEDPGPRRPAGAGGGDRLPRRLVGAPRGVLDGPGVCHRAHAPLPRPGPRAGPRGAPRARTTDERLELEHVPWRDGGRHGRARRDRRCEVARRGALARADQGGCRALSRTAPLRTGYPPADVTGAPLPTGGRGRDSRRDGRLLRRRPDARLDAQGDRRRHQPAAGRSGRLCRRRGRRRDRGVLRPAVRRPDGSPGPAAPGPRPAARAGGAGARRRQPASPS